MKKLGLFILVCIFLFAVNPAFAAKKKKPVELEITSYDGFKLGATLDVPNYATIENKAPLVIFLHSICKSQIGWNDFPKEVKVHLDVATLNVDLRGHGKSIRNKNNKRLYWQKLKLSDFKKMPEDITEVLKYIEKEYPEIDSGNIAIIGSSLGATVGLMAASYETKENIKTVIMLSPMLEYKGFDLRLPIVKYGNHPLLFIVSEKDKYPYESSQELIKFPQGKKLLKAYPFGGHGEDLLVFQPESRNFIFKWLEASLPHRKIEVKKNEKESAKKSKFKYKEVKEYSGKIQTRGDIYGGVH